MSISLEGMDEAEIRALALLAKSTRDNPKTRDSWLNVVQEANPNLVIPELQAKRASHEALSARDKEIAELKAQVEADRAQAAAQARIAALREEGVVRNANEFSEVVKYAAENGFQTSDEGLKRAAAARRAEQEAAVPTTTSAIPKPHIGNKDLMRNPQGWARTEAANVMDEIIKQRGRAAY